jgi:hypothetical protein
MRLMLRTVGVHSDHFSTSLITSQTRLGDAWISTVMLKFGIA